jgi:hypothetical protein
MYLCTFVVVAAIVLLKVIGIDELRSLEKQLPNEKLLCHTEVLSGSSTALGLARTLLKRRAGKCDAFFLIRRTAGVIACPESCSLSTYDWQLVPIGRVGWC